MERFEKRLIRCKKQIEKKPEYMIRMRPVLKEIMREIAILKAEHEGFTGVEIREKMMEEIRQQILQYCKVGGRIVGTQIQILALQNIRKNFNEYKGYLKECQQKTIQKKLNRKYPEQIEEASQLLVEELVYGMQVQKIQNQDASFSDFINQTGQAFLEEKMKAGQIELLEQAGKFFKKYHLLERYNQTNSREMAEMGIRDFRYPVTVDEKTGKNDPLAIEESFDPDYLKNLGVKELTFVSAYWQNRFSKAKELVNRCFYILDEYNLWEKESEEIIDDLENEDIKSSLIKRRVLESITDEILEEVIEDERKTGNGDLKRSVNRLLGINQKGFKEEFDGDLREEVSMYIKEMADNCNIYKVKSENIYSLLMGLRDNSTVKNWGLIIEGNTQENILVGIDYPGYNMPVRLHVKREEFINWMTNMKQNLVFQKYEGNNDFFFNGRQVSTNVLMPESEQQRRYLKEKAKQIQEDDFNYRIVSHIAANAEGDLPIHLKQVTKNDRGVTFIKTIKRYVKVMKNGEDEICVKDKRGHYVKYEGDEEVPR